MKEPSMQHDQGGPAPDSGTPRATPAPSADRKAKLAAALRRNLARRKARPAATCGKGE